MQQDDDEITKKQIKKSSYVWKNHFIDKENEIYIYTHTHTHTHTHIKNDKKSPIITKEKGARREKVEIKGSYVFAPKLKIWLGPYWVRPNSKLMNKSLKERGYKPIEEVQGYL